MKLEGQTRDLAVPTCNIQDVDCNAVHLTMPNCIDSAELSLMVRITTQIVAVSFDIEQHELLCPRRGTTRVARARQIAAYLLNTTLSLSLVEIGRLFRKDRTTIGYACRLVEDLRDEPAFDNRISELEKTIKLVMDLAKENL